MPDTNYHAVELYRAVTPLPGRQWIAVMRGMKGFADSFLVAGDLDELEEAVSDHIQIVTETGIRDHAVVFERWAGRWRADWKRALLAAEKGETRGYVPYDLGFCVRCRKVLQPSDTTGVSGIDSPDREFILCEQCFFDEEAETGEQGNVLPDRIKQYLENARLGPLPQDGTHQEARSGAAATGKQE